MARHCTAFRTILTLGLWCGYALLAGTASAYEDQASFDMAVGGTVTAGAETLGRGGPEVSVGGAVGLGDMFVLRSQFGYVPLFKSGDIQHTGRVRVEATYLLDVLTVVPFFGLGVNLWLYRNLLDEALLIRPGGHLVLGLDYLMSRTWTLGLDVRIGMLVEPNQMVSANEAQFRISRMFDMF